MFRVISTIINCTPHFKPSYSSPEFRKLNIVSPKRKQIVNNLLKFRILAYLYFCTNGSLTNSIKQVFYHMIHALSPFAFSVYSHRVWYFAQADIEPWCSYNCFLNSWDNKHTPPYPACFWKSSLIFFFKLSWLLSMILLSLPPE